MSGRLTQSSGGFRHTGYSSESADDSAFEQDRLEEENSTNRRRRDDDADRSYDEDEEKGGVTNLLHNNGHASGSGGNTLTSSATTTPTSTSRMIPQYQASATVGAGAAPSASSTTLSSYPSTSKSLSPHSQHSQQQQHIVTLPVRQASPPRHRNHDDDDYGSEDDELDEEEMEGDSDDEHLRKENINGAGGGGGVGGVGGVIGGGGGSSKSLNDQPQACSNWIMLYFIGLLFCIIGEFVILLPAFYLRLYIVGLMYFLIWLSLAIAAVQMRICPGRKKAHSTISLVLFVSALAAFVGGISGAYYYKQVWYFNSSDTIYSNVNPHVSPVSGVDDSAPASRIPVAEPLVTPSFLEFISDPAATDALGKSAPLTAFVFRNAPGSNATSVGVYVDPSSGTTYCASAITHTHTQWSDTPGPVTPMIYYWAVGKNCCGMKDDGSKEAMWTNCKYWGENLPGTRQLVDFSGEVLEDKENTKFRKAIGMFLQTTQIPSNHDSLDSYLIEVMTLNDHYSRQTLRRTNATICLLTAAIFWPLLYGAFFLVLWMWSKFREVCRGGGGVSGSNGNEKVSRRNSRDRVREKDEHDRTA